MTYKSNEKLTIGKFFKVISKEKYKELPDIIEVLNKNGELIYLEKNFSMTNVLSLNFGNKLEVEDISYFREVKGPINHHAGCGCIFAPWMIEENDYQMSFEF